MGVPTAEEVSASYDFTGKTAIVTGSNVGIGKETARVMALRNCHVIMACRSVEKGEEAKREIIASIGHQKAHLLEVMELDLSSLTSVQRFASTFSKRNSGSPSLHYLINNAGVMSLLERQSTQDGFEAHFGINHVAPFLLTQLLLPLLQKSAPSRIIVVSSEAHRFVRGYDLSADPKTLFLDPPDGRPASRSQAYALSKLYNIMFATELHRRLQGTHVAVSCLHPGIIITNLGREIPQEIYQQQVESLAKGANVPVFSIGQGAATTLFAVGSEEGGRGGAYFMDCKVATPREDAVLEPLNKELWALSERLVAPFLSKL